MDDIRQALGMFISLSTSARLTADTSYDTRNDK